MTFLDVKTDYAFKKVFGSNENKINYLFLTKHKIKKS